MMNTEEIFKKIGKKIEYINDLKEENLIEWNSKEFKDWLNTTQTESGRYLSEPEIERLLVVGGNDLVIYVQKLVYPTDEDYEAYAHWAGYNNYEEAACYYGDMRWSRDGCMVVVDTIDIDEFPQLMASYRRDKKGGM